MLYDMSKYYIKIPSEKLMFDDWRGYISKSRLRYQFFWSIVEIWDDFIEEKTGKRPFHTDRELAFSEFEFNSLEEILLFKLRFG